MTAQRPVTSMLENLAARLVTVVALATILALGSLAYSADDAHADGSSVLVSDDKSDDGTSHILIFKDKDGYWMLIWAKGEGWTYVDLGTSGSLGNPNPEDPSSGGPDIDMMMDLAKQHGGGLAPAIDFFGTELGLHLSQHGATIVPFHNPADFENEFDGIGGSGGGFDPTAGSIREQLKQAADSGDDDDGDDGSPDPTNGEGLFGELPGPPELVNPAPMTR